MIEVIRKELFALQDEKYRAFQVKLFPTLDPDTIIGVRTPELRSYAKKILKEEGISSFLSDLPHKYFDENQLHAFIVSEMKDYGRCIEEVSCF
ncbi:MAG: DNA alkylation repair protein, partial [Spirochaetales bacterium]|nr:DNA alkylation repair protein [Spirochaetales bacterium]